MNLRRLKFWSLAIFGFLLGLILLALFGLWVFLRSSLAQLDGTVHAPQLTADVVVTRDALGIPVISGANREDLAYAAGYVHAQERFFQMDLTRRAGAGELAELFGARALPLDRARRLHRFRARAAVTLAQLSPSDRAMIDRYTAGVNAGLEALAAYPFEYKLIGLKPRAWESADSLLVVWAMFFDLQGNIEPRELARGWLRDNSTPEQLAFLLPEASGYDAPLDAPGVTITVAPIPATAPAWWGKRSLEAETAVAALSASETDIMVGSNNWAVSGRRSADGAAIVSDDMHLGLRLPNTWFRQVLQYPDPKGGTRRVVGVALPGAGPMIAVGSNGHVAWGFTNSYGDYLDLVQVDTDAEHPGQVRTPAGWETPVSVDETILVKGSSATKLVVRSVALGPLREAGDKTYAMHWTAHLPGAINMNIAKAELANTLDELLAVAKTAGIPAQNFVAGDDRGNIGWTIGGLLPRRANASVASTFPLKAGSADAGWDGTLVPADYPTLRNPEGGQLVTANSRQLNGPGAALIGDGGFDLGARTRQAADGLAALGSRVDVKAVYGVTLDDRALFMAPWRERALKVLDEAALDKQPLRAEFRRLLKESWTGHASVDSVGYRMARQFMWALNLELFGGANAEMEKLDARSNAGLATSRWPVVVARLLDEQPAGWLPPDYKDWRQLQLVAIDKVIAEALKENGKLAGFTWGNRNTAAIEHPIAAAAPFLRHWLSVPADMLPGDNHMPRVSAKAGGQSERMTVTPGKEESGIFNMPGGQSGHPMSPFFLNGHADWVKGTPTPLLPGIAKHRMTFVK